MAHSAFFFICMLALAALHGIHAVEYIVNNRATTTPGGIRFQKRAWRRIHQAKNGCGLRIHLENLSSKHSRTAH
ncbi:hypothetical protein AB3S75_043503 [Citrus x aurantiifolia]